MKLKKYFSGSFPRVRNKKKKNSKKGEDADNPNTESRLYDSTTLPRRGCVNDAYLDTAYEGYNLTSAPYTCDNNCNSLTLSYTDKLNSNCTFDESDNECYCYRNINNNDLKFDKCAYSVLSWSYSEGDTDKNYLSNTVPKSRSRIRTNPWLPSPKLTPTPSSSSKSSSSSSPTSSTASSPTSDDALLCPKSRRSTSSEDSAMDIDDLNEQTILHNDDTICDDSKLGGDAFINEFDLTRNKKFNGKDIMFSDPDSPTVERDLFKHHADKANYEEALEGLLENETCSVKHDETVLSIQDLLQADDQLFFQDELNKGCKKVHSALPLQCTLDGKIDRCNDMDDEDINLLEEGLTERVCCDTNCVPDCMNLSTDTGYASLGRNIWKSKSCHQNMEILECDEWDKENGMTVNADCVTNGIVCSCQLDSDGCEIDDRSQGYDSDIATECPNPVGAMQKALHLRGSDITQSSRKFDGYESDTEQDSKCGIYKTDDNDADDDDDGDDDGECLATRDGSVRSLVEIKSSLAEKVFYLRQEKRIVEEKIREAREEDKIRRQQKMKFQKHVASQRKQLLLKTLQDLRHKLENQSLRLQTCYNITLTMQKRISDKELPVLFL